MHIFHEHTNERKMEDTRIYLSFFHKHSTEHGSIVSDNVVQRTSSITEKIASKDYEARIILSAEQLYLSSR